MTDAEFIAAFESCALSNEAFRHREHLRLAWLYLRRAPYDEAVRMMECSIRRFAAHHGALDKYHHTITLLWMRLVAVAAASDDHATFDSFITAHGHLLDKNVPKHFYSAHRLSSARARMGWLDPDLRPLPEPTRSVAAATIDAHNDGDAHISKQALAADSPNPPRDASDRLAHRAMV